MHLYMSSQWSTVLNRLKDAPPSWEVFANGSPSTEEKGYGEYAIRAVFPDSSPPDGFQLADKANHGNKTATAGSDAWLPSELRN